MTRTEPSTPGRSTGRATGRRQADAGAPVVGDGPVTKAALRDIAGIARRDPGLANGALAASIVALAQGIDNPKNSLTSKAMAQRALREALDRLRELAPPEETSDVIDDLQEKAGRKLGLA